jgi:hypothetical protein
MTPNSFQLYMYRDKLVSIVAIVTPGVVAATTLRLVAISVVVIASGIPTIVTATTSWCVVITLLVIIRRRSRVAILILTTLVVVVLAVVARLVVALCWVLITMTATAWRWRTARIARTACRRGPSTSTTLRRRHKGWI